MTATVIAILIERGKLSWETTPLDVFPEWKDKILPDHREVTLTNLLSHRAGIPAYEDDESQEFREVKSLSGTPTEQRREFAQRALRHKPAAPRGTKRLYSNGGYSIAAAMTERATEQAWEFLVHTRLFEPLGIHATLDWPAFADALRPWGHYETKASVRPHDPRDKYQLPGLLPSPF